MRPRILMPALAALAALAALPPTAAAQEKAAPNIVVLMTDDQTLESMSVMPRTRELLGGNGTTFTRSFVNFSLCCPSRATLYTGQYAHNHGVFGNAPPGGGFAKLDTSNWLPLWLQSAGYRTMHVGKFLNGYGRPPGLPTDVPPGFNDWHGTVDPSTYRFYDYTVNENGTLVTYGANGEQDFYSTDFFTRRANELIAAAAPADTPFFMSVAFLAPHSGAPRENDDPTGHATPAVAPRHKDRFASVPVPVPPSFNEADVSDKPMIVRRRPVMNPNRIAAVREGYQQRLESLLAVDEGIESIVGALDAAGELRNTLIIFTADNGFFHGEHRVRIGKVLLYEPSIRLPLIMRGPGVPSGERRGQLVTNADLAPTILEAAGGRAGRTQDGRSLFGLLRDRRAEWGRELLLEGTNTEGPFAGLRNYRFKYLEHVNGEVELYDLARDPDELLSLHGDPALARLRAAFSARLRTLRACAGRTCRAKPVLRLGAGRRCDARRVVAAVRGAEAPVVDRVEFLAGRRAGESLRFRRLAVDGRRPFRKRLRARGRLSSRRLLLRARVRLGDGRSVTIDKRLRACR